MAPAGGADKVRETTVAAPPQGESASGMEARSVLDRYLASRAAERQLLFGAQAEEPATKRVAKRLFPAPLRMRPRLVATRALRVREGRRLAALPRPLRLHLGSGNEHKDGWVNIDLAGYPVEAGRHLARGCPGRGRGSALVCRRRRCVPRACAAGPPDGDARAAGALLLRRPPVDVRLRDARAPPARCGLRRAGATRLRRDGSRAAAGQCAPSR